MFDVAELVRTGLYLPDSDNVKSYVFSTTLRALVCNECCPFLCSGMHEKLIELVRKCEELYQIGSVVTVSGKKNCGNK